MRTSSPVVRSFRWLALVGTVVLPAFVMRCDKAALNVQRGFYEGLGLSLSQMLVEQGFLVAGDQTQE